MKPAAIPSAMLYANGIQAMVGLLYTSIVTAGGVDVSQVNPKTMESKLLPGLYFAGEVLDVDGYTGGFNLQIAFSTAFAAGNHC